MGGPGDTHCSGTERSPLQSLFLGYQAVKRQEGGFVLGEGIGAVLQGNSVINQLGKQLLGAEQGTTRIRGQVRVLQSQSRGGALWIHDECPPLP